MLLTLFYRWTRRVKAFFLVGASAPLCQPAAGVTHAGINASTAAALRTAAGNAAPVANALSAIAPTMHLTVEVTRV